MILGFQSLVREIVMDSVTLVVLCELDLHGTVKGIFWRKLEKMVALVHCLLGNHFLHLSNANASALEVVCD